LTYNKDNDKPYEVTIDQVAVMGILKCVQNSEEAMATGNIDSSIVWLDSAWCRLPPATRGKLKSASAEIIESYRVSVPSREDLKLDSAFTSFSGEDINRHINKVKGNLAAQLMTDYKARLITIMEDDGLYVKKGSGVTPTSERQATEAPPTKGLPTTMERTFSG